ncbi:M36 family metallopeptidase [Micromonospora chokoriensis]|uniref:M36 family metallopeptidase n=1 Tax=Micromonospora chokoriensis TaxID=356851 RepID=UPI00055F9DC1|nr:M36 family metallopeptidase [Micromonospora chokoriensis]
MGAAAAAVLCLSLSPTVGHAAPNAAGSAPAPAKGNGQRLKPYDVRTGSGSSAAIDARRASTTANTSAAVVSLRSELGIQGIVDIDPFTSTPRQVARLDGFLTGPSHRPPLTVALSYIKAHQGVFMLDADEVDALRLRKDYVDIAGTHHLSLQQTVDGVPLFGGGLKADVTKDGRLIQVNGSPVATLSATTGLAKVTAAQARDAALRDVAGSTAAKVTAQRADAAQLTEFSSGDQAQRVVFQAPGGLRVAWQTVLRKEGYLHVIDAQSGRVLFRSDLVANDRGDAWTLSPGAPGAAGHQRSKSFGQWLPKGSSTLSGANAHVFLDLNDNDVADQGEEVGPSSPGRFEYPFKDFTSQVGAPCSAAGQCSWDPKVPYSWQANAKQNATQLFFLANNFHDHLAESPIGFTSAAGNFEVTDGDAVEVQGLDGANTAGGLPNSRHVNNANMSTPPDGIAPTMQMYLFHDPTDSTDPVIAGNSGDSADVVYHEYTHGLSNRLVVDASGVSTLTGPQGGAMGEAWSDWYALDYLVNEGLTKDTAAPGQLVVGDYLTAGLGIRTQPLDCPVGAKASICPGNPEAGSGGYTYGDFGRVSRGVEVHSDGEIWAETLWDLRTALGQSLSESLVTRAMELAPTNPSFLDMRNSILQADLVVNEGRKRAQIWKVFAARGMGWFAGATGGDDTRPVEDFSMPPGPNAPRGTLTGKVTQESTGAPVAGAVVSLAGHASGFAGSYTATTDATGTYRITDIVRGTYPKVIASSQSGFDPALATKLTIEPGRNVQNWSLRRDWAALSGGGAVVDFNGPDYTEYTCGPSSLIDQSQGSGWGSEAVFASPTGPMDPRYIVVSLPAPVDVSEIAINPSGTCGDDGSASAGDYRVETSPDGNAWTVASTGHFGIANRDVMNSVALAPAATQAVRYVRYTILGNQVADEGGTCPGPYDGCQFVDSVELTVYGSPSN